MQFKAQYVVLAGVIGVGKSTFTQRLAREREFIPFYEQPDNNPYLPDYYAGKPVSFEMQQYFITQFWEQVAAIRDYLKQGHCIVQDRSVYEVLEIFSRLQHMNGDMSDKQWEIQQRLCRYSFEFMPKPDLIIHLDAPTEVLLQRIANRGRVYEQQISGEFLQTIRNLYDQWVERLVNEGAYIEGSGKTPKAGRWSGTRIMQLRDWGQDLNSNILREVA